MMITHHFSHILNKKFSRDIFTNGLSIISVSLNVLLINTVIGKYYSVNVLGIYHISLAVYMIVTTFSTLGVSNSILKYSAEVHEDRSKLSAIASSGLILIALFSLFIFIIFYFMLSINLFQIHDKNILIALKRMFFAMPLFAINKGFRSFFNGIRRMKVYAAIDCLRWLIISLAIFGCIVFRKNFLSVFYSFLLAESFIFFTFIFYSKKFFDFTYSNLKKYYITHLSFGLKTILGSFLLIINAKADILLISYLTLNNSNVGVYAFAAEIAKGVLYLSTIVQINFSPIISKLCANNQIPQLRDYIKKISKGMFFILVPIITLMAILYPLYIHLMFENEVYQTSISVFYIVLAGVGFASLFFWCGTILSMAGFPQDSIKRNIILIFSTVLFNILLIPTFGIIGAALATSFSYIVRIFTLRYFVKKRLGIKLIW